MPLRSEQPNRSNEMHTFMKHTLTLLLSLLFAPLATLHAAEPVTIDLAKRTWQGIPGLERTAKERVFVSWFTGGHQRART